MTVSRDEFCLVNISETVSESYRNIERNASEMLQFSVESQVLNVHPKKNLLTTYKVSRALFHEMSKVSSCLTRCLLSANSYVNVGVYPG